MHFHAWGKWEEKATYNTYVHDPLVEGKRRRIGGSLHMQRACNLCGEIQVKEIKTP